MDWEGLLDSMTAVVRDTFAVSVVYERYETGEVIDKTPGGAGLTGIVDTETLDTKAGDTRAASNRRTVLDVRLADLGFTPVNKDKVTVSRRGFSIAAGVYEVMDKDPSSSGMMKLVLRKVVDAEPA